MKPIVARFLFAAGLTVAGFFIGAWIGASFFVSRADGLAGGPMVLGYGVLGGLVALVVGVVTGRRLEGYALTFAALAAGGVAAALVGGLIVSLRNTERAAHDPESDYAGIPAFDITLERTTVLDPYLWTKMSVDARERQWEMTGAAPDHRVCRGTIRAAEMAAIGAALTRLGESAGDALPACRATANDGIERITWSLEANASSPPFAGTLDVSARCASDVAEVAAVVQAVGRATIRQKTKIRCD